MAKVVHTESTKLIDHRAEVDAHFEVNMRRALTAVGEAAVGFVVKQMQSGYQKPVRDTGALMQSINHAEEIDGAVGRVNIGTNLKYALFVHEGYVQKKGLHFQDKQGNWHTTKGRHIAGRPFLRDGIAKGWGRLQQLFAAYLKEGFEK